MRQTERNVAGKWRKPIEEEFLFPPSPEGLEMVQILIVSDRIYWLM